MHWIEDMMKWHPILSGAIAMAVANAAITSLPSPDTSSGKFYRWFFTCTHSLILAIPRLVAQYNQTGESGSGGK
jgi:succinylarginine dihydrolase